MLEYHSSPFPGRNSQLSSSHSERLQPSVSQPPISYGVNALDEYDKFWLYMVKKDSIQSNAFCSKTIRRNMACDKMDLFSSTSNYDVPCLIEFSSRSVLKSFACKAACGYGSAAGTPFEQHAFPITEGMFSSLLS